MPKNMEFPVVDKDLVQRLREAVALSSAPSVYAKGRELASRFPMMTLNTLNDYIHTCEGAGAEGWDAFMSDKISMGELRELSYLRKDYQSIVLEERLKSTPRQFGASVIVKIKRAVGEGQSISEAIARAKGDLPATREEDSINQKSLDALLSEIASLGSRWRAKVTTVFEGLRDLEKGMGAVYLPLFERSVLLREMIGEQYEYVDKTVKRYLRVLKNRVNTRKEPAP